MQLADKLEADELLALLLSGPAHDLGHPGVNNTYLNNAAHVVSTQYDKVPDSNLNPIPENMRNVPPQGHRVDTSSLTLYPAPLTPNPNC